MKIDNSFLVKDFLPSTDSTKKASSDNSFINMLDSISNKENAVAQMKTEYANGERDDIQNILIEGQKVNLEINFALQVRNNLVNMFQQLSTMQV